jgi:putative molybdopterin biosynthesis protein
MVRKEQMNSVRSFADLAGSRLRFVNRQIGSGTRMLTDHLMNEHSLDPRKLPGYFEALEDTHVAVAASIASGVADVGVGIEAAAIEFGLHFVPLVQEDYFLACLKPSLELPAVQHLCALLAANAWSDLLKNLPGYAPAARPGEVLKMTSALPWWRYRSPAAKVSAKARKPASTRELAERDT